MNRHAFRLAALAVVVCCAVTSFAHPGAAIAVSKDGVIYFIDTGAGVFSIDRSGHTVRHEGPGFHWFAFDESSRYRNTPWPYMPGAEFRSTGVNPTLVRSSDYPVTIGSDGRFYYPDGTDGSRVRIVAIAPGGARTTRATLPPIHRGGQTITWLNGLAPAEDGSLYYTEDQTVRRIDANGKVSTVLDGISVPNCAAVPGSDADTGPYLRGLAVAHDGSVYVAAAGCAALLKIDAKKHVTVVLRSTPPWSPTAVALLGDDVYVLEYLHTASDDRREWIPRVRKIAKGGAVVTLGGPTRK